MRLAPALTTDEPVDSEPRTRAGVNRDPYQRNCDEYGHSESRTTKLEERIGLLRMTTSMLVQEGLQLMALGMGAVFVFLSLLIVSMTITARLVRGIEQRRPTDSTSTPTQPPTALPDSHVIAAISIAVRRYRKTHQR